MRLVVTGVGLVTSLGVGREETWSRVVRGDRGIERVELFDASELAVRIAGEVRGIVAEASRTGAPGSRTSAMATIAAREAMEHAAVDVRSRRVGLVLGGTTGGMLENEALVKGVLEDRSKRETLEAMRELTLGSMGRRVDEALGPFSRVRVVSSACSSGATAIAIAAQWLLEGACDVVVAGGADGLCRLTYAGFHALGVMDPDPCRPFDVTRRGLTLGEGAGVVVLERASDAAARGAKVVAELGGWSLGAEAHHVTNPEPEGTVASRVMARALARAGLDAAHVDYVNAHGTATVHNDAMETRAIARVLGAETARVPVSSTKGQIGHTLGASGAIEAAITALVVERQMLVPTVGLGEPDPACALVHVRDRGRPARVRAAISNAFGFGGMCAAIVLTEPGLGHEHDEVPRAVLDRATATRTPEGIAALDGARARRLDRTTRACVGVMEATLAEAPPASREACGVVMATKFGAVEASATFLKRLFDVGPRLVSPAEFPSLLPSAPAGLASIYLGLRGPALVVAQDDARSHGDAEAQARELVRAGEADDMVVATVDTSDDIPARVVSALDRGAEMQATLTSVTASVLGA